MHNKVISIVRIFPDFEQKIDFLFRTDEGFRDLCSDHILCAAMVLDLKREEDLNVSKLEEYEELQRSLEQEILCTILKA